MPTALNRSVIDAINKTYVDMFEDHMAAIVPTVPERAGLVFPLTGVLGGKNANIAFMRNYVRMREWINEREHSDGIALEHLITNAEYEATIKLLISDIEDNQFVLQGKSDVAQLVDAYNRRKNTELHRLMDDAFTSTDTFDGVPLISESHPRGELVYDKTRPRGQRYRINAASTWSNRLTGDPDLTEDNLWAAREAFLLRKDHMGEPLDVMPNLLIVGPTQERLARTILNNNVKNDSGAAVDNETKDLFQLSVDPRITGNAWFLTVANAPLKPFVFWNRVPPQLQRTGGPTFEGLVPDSVFFHKSLFWGLRTRMGFAYGSPEYIYGSAGQ
jgi:phage major head subunit gpT-like protein